jgi:hypothetical protein
MEHFFKNSRGVYHSLDQSTIVFKKYTLVILANFPSQIISTGNPLFLEDAPLVENI